MASTWEVAMPGTDWPALAAELQTLLNPTAAPIGITFTDAPVQGVPAFDEPMAEPAPDGRTGRVPAGCVFWMKSTDKTFSTVAEDHGNCSVGSMTHGFKTLDEVAGNSDVAALFESGWVTMDDVPKIPLVSKRPASIVYGPLAETPVDPDVVLLRLSPKSMMVLSDALPGLSIEGKPQCHIVAMAKEHSQPAASVGCMLSRVRTGMSNGEMTAALPASQLPEIVGRLQRAESIDGTVGRYAAEDSRRFGEGRFAGSRE
jgi:uncharacterized protein (DUF169 family)